MEHVPKHTWSAHKNGETGMRKITEQSYEGSHSESNIRVPVYVAHDHATR